METKKQKYYVVWSGRICGVFDNWKSCNDQVFGFDGAKYKSFESKIEADKAFLDGYAKYYKKNREWSYAADGSDQSRRWIYPR